MKKYLPSLSMLPFFILLVMFVVLPIGLTLIYGFQNNQGEWSLANYDKIVSSPFYLQAIKLSLSISFWPSLFAMIIGLIGSYSLFVMQDSRLGRFIMAFTSMTSNFTGVPLAFAFIIILGSNGVISLLFRAWGIDEVVNLYSHWGIIVTYTYFQIPLAILLLYPAFTALRSDWQESAALLGAGPLTYARKIAIPVLFPTLLGTFVILFANALGAYATVYALTTGNFNVLPVRIAALIAGNLVLEPHLAAALATLLMLLMLIVTVVQQWLNRYQVAK